MSENNNGKNKLNKIISTLKKTVFNIKEKTKPTLNKIKFKFENTNIKKIFENLKIMILNLSKKTIILISIIVIMIIGFFILKPVLFSNNSKKEQTNNSADSNLQDKKNTNKTNPDLSMEEIQNNINHSVVVISIKPLSKSENQSIVYTSGLIIDSSGYIVLSTHSISGYDKASEISVILPDDKNTYYPAEFIDNSSEKDLSLIKINAENLNVPDFGDSSKLKLGQTVISVCNPGGLDYIGTITKGAISGLDRALTYSNVKLNLIQIDEEISHGDSGSALTNQKGEVIGLNTNLFNSDENRFGFAIPINYVLEYTDSILNNLSNSKINNPFIGLTITPKENSKGLYVDTVIENSSADISGIKEGDIILKFDETELNTYEDLENFKSNSKVGDTINVTLIRNNETINISLLLKETN